MWRIVVGLVLAALAMQLVRPARTNPPTDPTRTLTSAIPVSHDASNILDRACRDCHTSATRWPWYSNVAPVSWFVIDHVNSGRRHFNYSDWARYDQRKKRELLKKTCDLTRKGDMPIGSYVWMHPEARISDRDAAALCGW